MSIQGNNGFLDLENASLRVTGNVHAEGFKVGSVRLQSAYSLQSITGVSNVTNDMIQFTNPTKSFDATSNIEVGNGNLFVNTTTSNVGIGTNMPTSTLDVRGDASVSGNTSVSGNVSVGEVIGLSFGNIPTINFDQVSNVSQIKSNSNVVMEYKLSTRDYETKEPRIALTANSDRGYVASASKEESTSRQAWKIFNNVQAEGDGWRSSTSDIEYNASGTYVGSTNLGTGAVNGEWVQIQLPYKIKLERFTLQPRLSTPIVPGSSPSLNYGRSEFIKNGKIYGSNDGVSWSLVHTITGISASTDTSIVSVIVDSSSAYYKYFGLVITDTNTSSASAAGTALSEWELYGTPLTANVATGTDVVLHTTPNVPKTDFSNVYYDGQDYTSMPATVADKSGNGVTGTPSGGVGFDSTYKAFTFSGGSSGDKITATLTNPAGAWVHSASMWFKVNALTKTHCLFSVNNDDTGDTDRTLRLELKTTGTLKYNFNNNIVIFGSDDTIRTGEWYHLSATYSGGSDAPSRKLFLNGVELGISSTSGTIAALNAHANALLKIGTRESNSGVFNGSIANFRLYNQALSADEIWELYAYQKEYFGVSPDVVTLKAGRVGIGTSEPRAVLDVRGSSRFDAPITLPRALFNPGYSRSAIIYTGGYYRTKYQNVHEYYQNLIIPPASEMASYGIDAQWYTLSNYTAGNALNTTIIDTLVYWLKNRQDGHIHESQFLVSGGTHFERVYGQKFATHFRLWGYGERSNHTHTKYYVSNYNVSFTSAAELSIYYSETVL